MTAHASDRRTFLTASGAALTVALAAGCLGGDDDDGGDGFGDWLDDANGDTSVEDHIGEDEVTVDVGAGSNGWAFSPAAISVDVGTTVVWEWTGEGGGHDVVDEDGTFESERTTEAGFTFEHAFDEAGEYRYKCVPHEGAGMKGAVEVVE